MATENRISIRTDRNKVASLDQVPTDYYPVSVIIHRETDEIFYDPSSWNDGKTIYCLFGEMFWKGAKSQYSDTYTSVRYCLGLNGIVSPLVTRKTGNRPGLGSVEFWKGYYGFTFEFQEFKKKNIVDYIVGSNEYFRYIIFDFHGIEVFSKVILFEPNEDEILIRFNSFQIPPMYNKKLLRSLDITGFGDDQWHKICFSGRTLKDNQIEFMLEIFTNERCQIFTDTFKPAYIHLANPA